MCKKKKKKRKKEKYNSLKFVSPKSIESLKGYAYKALDHRMKIHFQSNSRALFSHHT